MITLVASVEVVPAEAAGRHWQWPLHPQPPVARTFEPPAESWSAGHRGVDLRGGPLQPVLAAASGQVTFAGVVAGRGVVVVRHGSLRSTYQPVTAAVHVGQAVAGGEVVGLLQTAGSHCAPQACLHLGVRRGDTYVDPLALLGPQRVVLRPLDEGGGASESGGSPLPLDLGASLLSPDPPGGWPPGRVPRHPAPAWERLRSAGAPSGSIEVGVAAVVAQVVTSLLTALGAS